MKKRIVAADPHVYKRMLDPAVYPHVAPQVRINACFDASRKLCLMMCVSFTSRTQRQSDFQAYTLENAQFILHFPGPRPRKLDLLLESLAEVRARAQLAK